MTATPYLETNRQRSAVADYWARRKTAPPVVVLVDPLFSPVRPDPIERAISASRHRYERTALLQVAETTGCFIDPEMWLAELRAELA